MGIARYVARGSIGHHIFGTLQCGTLHILVVVVKHLVGQVATGEKLAHGKLLNAAVDEEPRLVAVQIVQAQ